MNSREDRSPGLRSPFITRVRLRNFKSIPICNVALGPLQLIVGRNAAGKSNLLDAIAFVSDSLNSSLELALKDRGGFDLVRLRSPSRPDHFEIRLDVQVEDGRTGSYSFEVADGGHGGYRVKRESGQLGPHGFVYENGLKVTSTHGQAPDTNPPQHLVLPLLAGQEEFEALAACLRGMGVYKLEPSRMRGLRDSDQGLRLLRDGCNLASVIREMHRLGNGDYGLQVNGHLRALAPGVSSVKWMERGSEGGLEVRQEIGGEEDSWPVPAASLSDGTLRALGVLVACSQGAPGFPQRASLIGLEEPETSMHPCAVETVADFLLMASKYVQIIATTNSPELLDNKKITDEHLLVVENRSGQSIVTTVDPVARGVIRERLYSAGELLSRGQLQSHHTLISLTPASGAEADRYHNNSMESA